MVNVLLVSDGGSAAGFLKTRLSHSYQIELLVVSSLKEGTDHTRSASPDIICLPLPSGDNPDIGIIEQWQEEFRQEGYYPGLLGYVTRSDRVFFFDITYGSFSIAIHSHDAEHQLISSLRQVTNRAKVERSLREDYDLNNQIISAMPLSCVGVEGGSISTITPFFTSLTGFEEHEAVGMPVHSLFSPEHAHNKYAFLESLYLQKSLDIAITDKNGMLIPCRITFHPKESGKTGDGLWFIEDRREYAAINAILRETEYECKEQLYLTETLVMRISPDGTISFANPATSRCFGYDPEEFSGMNVHNLFPPGMLQDITSPADVFLEVTDKSSSAIHIFEHVKKDGGRLWIAWTSRGLYSSESELTGIICIGTDMTEQTSVGNERMSTRVWRDRIIQSTDIIPEVFDAVLQACMEIGREGREGKAIGTAFLLGDSDRVLQNSRQLILNPFQGHPPEVRNVIMPDMREMLKEYALLDGAFVVSGEGLLEAAGRYITLDTSGFSLPKGMGTRHSSVAALTGVTDTIGFVVSESGGKVSIMKKGKIVKVVA